MNCVTCSASGWFEGELKMDGIYNGILFGGFNCNAIDCGRDRLLRCASVCVCVFECEGDRLHLCLSDLNSIVV